MKNNINEILKKYTNNEITVDEANKALDEAGANFHLNPKDTGGWTEDEMKEGFRPGEPAEILPDRPDMKRRIDLAGQTVVQRTKAGAYNISYDEDGMAVRASRIK